MRISSPRSKSDREAEVGDRGPAGRPRDRSRISIHSVVGVPDRHVLEGVDVEVGVEPGVEHVQHVPVELGGDAGRVVVGAHQPVRVLHQIGAEQERVLGGQPAPDRGEEAATLRRGEVARWCRRGRRPSGCHRTGSGRGGARSRRPCRGSRAPGSPPRGTSSPPPAPSGTRRRGRSGAGSRRVRARRAGAVSSARIPTRARRACPHRTRRRSRPRARRGWSAPRGSGSTRGAG